MGECNGEMKCRICWRVVRGVLRGCRAGLRGGSPNAPRTLHPGPDPHRWDTSDAKRDARCVGGSSLLGWIGAIGMKDGLAESYR